MWAKLWAARLDRVLTEQEEQKLMALLPAQRRERLLRMKRPEKRREPLCAYWMLRTALAEQYQWQKNLPRMEYGPLGKPVFPDHPGIHFNLSHTDGAVLIGISDGQIGVDIEKIHPVSGALGKRLGGDTPEEFFRGWTRREARAKRSGTPVALGEEQPLLADEQLFSPEIFAGFAACVCVSGEASVEIRRYHMDDLMAMLQDTI